MKSEEDTIIRSEHEGGSAHASAESAEFVPGYQPERMTKITVPGLSEDASGMSAEALANIPTLTEQVAHEVAKAKPEPVADPVSTPALRQEPVAASDPVSPSPPAPTQPSSQVDPAPAEALPSEAEVDDLPHAETALAQQGAQDTSPEADSWLEQCQVRIDHLNDEIQQLNDRLDQLEQTTKV